MENTQILKLKAIHPAKEVSNGKKSHKAMSMELPFRFTLFYRFKKENFMLLLFKNKVKYTLFSAMLRQTFYLILTFRALDFVQQETYISHSKSLLRDKRWFFPGTR